MAAEVQWISVDDRLPELHGERFEDYDGSSFWYEASEWVLGIDCLGEMSVVIYETGPLWRDWHDCHHRTLQITHWLPLPPPPEV